MPAAPDQGYPVAAQPYQGAPPAAQQMMPSQAPPTQATPLYAQEQPQQQQESGGIWSTIKSIFGPPTTMSSRGMFDNRSNSPDVSM